MHSWALGRGPEPGRRRGVHERVANSRIFHPVAAHVREERLTKVAPVALVAPPRIPFESDGRTRVKGNQPGISAFAPADQEHTFVQVRGIARSKAMASPMRIPVAANRANTTGKTWTRRSPDWVEAARITAAILAAV